jgi:hypothetical protein
MGHDLRKVNGGCQRGADTGYYHAYSLIREILVKASNGNRSDSLRIMKLILDPGEHLGAGLQYVNDVSIRPSNNTS